MLNHQRRLTLPRPTAALTATQLRVVLTLHLLPLQAEELAREKEDLLAAVEDSATVMQEREQARPSRIPSLCTHFTRAGIEWRR